MTTRVTFNGWRSFSDTGTPYREWTLNEPVTTPDLMLCAGAELVDAGPVGNPRFYVVGKHQNTHERIDEDLTLEQVQELTGFDPFPAWPAFPEVLAGLSEGATATLASIREVLSGAKANPTVPVSNDLPTWARSFPYGDYITADIAGTRVRAGDVVVDPWGTRPKSCLRIPLTLDELTAMRDVGRDALYQYARPIRSDSSHLVMWDVLRDRRRWAIRHGKAGSVLMIYRLVTRESITAVEASSDDAAIFELLAETGCRPGGAS